MHKENCPNDLIIDFKKTKLIDTKLNLTISMPMKKIDNRRFKMSLNWKIDTSIDIIKTNYDLDSCNSN